MVFIYLEHSVEAVVDRLSRLLSKLLCGQDRLHLLLKGCILWLSRFQEGGFVDLRRFERLQYPFCSDLEGY